MSSEATIDTEAVESDETSEIEELKAYQDTDHFDTVGRDAETPDIRLRDDNQEDEGRFAPSVNVDGINALLSEKIYRNGEEAFLAEYLSNAETAGIRGAKWELLEEGYDPEWFFTGEVTDENGDVIRRYPRPTHEILAEAEEVCGYKPVIEVEWYATERKIVIQDNGIGMTHESFQVFRTTAQSGVHGDSDATGMFGIGSMSAQAVLRDGRMELLYRSRQNGDERHVYGSPFDGWDTINEEDVLPEGQYGVRFEVPVSEEAKKVNPYESTEQTAEQFKIPVVYQEYVDGELSRDEEFGGAIFTEWFDDPSVLIERPGEFTVIADDRVERFYDGPSYRSDRAFTTYLHSRSIENDMESRDAMFPVLCRIENEHGLIVDGPHKGKTRNELHHIDDDDVPLPEPTASRDDLETTYQDRFEQYICYLVNSVAQEKAGEYLSDLSDHSDVVDFIRSDKSGFELLVKVINETSQYGRAVHDLQTLKDHFEHGNYPDVSDEVAEAIWIATDLVKYVNDGWTPSRWGERANSKWNKSARKKIRLYDLIAKNVPIYSFKTASQSMKKRYKIAQSTHSSVFAIGCDKDVDDRYNETESIKFDHYDQYRKLGIEPLKEVPTPSQIDDDDDWVIPSNLSVSDSSSSSSGSKDVGDKKITIHKSSDNNTYNTTASKITSRNKYESEPLVVFGSMTDENLSDNKWVGRYAHFANLSQGQWDYLNEHGDGNYLLFGEWLDQSRETTIWTEVGEMSAAEYIDDDRTKIQVMVEEDSLEEWKDRRHIETMFTRFREEYGTFYGASMDIEDRPNWLMAVVTPKQAKQMAPAFNADNDLITYQLYEHTSVGGFEYSRYKMDNPMAYYHFIAETPRWNTEEGEELRRMASELFAKYNNLAERFIELLMGFYNAGFDVPDFDRSEVEQAVEEMCDD